MKHPNRMNARAPKRGLVWCFGCDASLVGEGGKCRRCGRRHSSPHERPRRDFRNLKVGNLADEG